MERVREALEEKKQEDQERSEQEERSGSDAPHQEPDPGTKRSGHGGKTADNGNQ